MDYVVGSVAALISGNVTPNRPKLLKRALTPTKHQPSPNVTPKSEFVEDKSIFLSPTQQKKKAIVKKSPKRIFQNPELDVTEDSEGNSSLTSPKAERVKKHLKDELGADDMVKKKSLSPKSRDNSLVISLGEVSMKKKSKILNDSVENESTPKKKKGKRSFTDSDIESKDTTQTEQIETPNVKKSNIKSPKKMKERRKSIADITDLQSNEEMAQISENPSKQVTDNNNENNTITQVTLNNQTGKKKNKKFKKKNNKSNQESNKETIATKEEKNNQDSPELNKQNLNKKKKRNRKNKTKINQVIEKEEIKLQEVEKMDVEENDDESESEAEEEKSKNLPNPNAITDKDSDSEHGSDDEIESENEQTTNEAAEQEESSDEEEEKPQKNKKKEKKAEEKGEEVMSADEIKRTLFVGNVPFSNKCKKEVKKIFSKYGQIDTIRIRTIPVKDARVTPKLAVIKNELHPERTTVNVYVKFADGASVTKALSENNSVLNGCHLRVSRSDSTGAEHDPRCAVFLGNLPFGIEDETLRSKFESCGEIASVRIIRDKKTNAGKGFGFVNFASKDGVELALALPEEDLTVKNRIIRVKRCVQAQSQGKKGGKVEGGGKFNSGGKFNNGGRFNSGGGKFNNSGGKFDGGGSKFNNSGGGRFNNNGGGRFNNSGGGRFNNSGGGRFNNSEGGRFNSQGGTFNSGGGRFNSGPNTGRNFGGPPNRGNQPGQEEGAARRLMHKRKQQESAGDGPPNKRQNVDQPIKEKKPKKEFVGMTAEKKKKHKFDKGQKKKKALSEILTKKA